MRRTACVLLGLATILPGSAFADSLVEGVWRTPEQAEMTIAPCNDGFCGKLSRIVVTDDQTAKYGVDASSLKVEDLTDMLNEKPELRGRPMLGLNILTLKATDNPWYFEGEIYNPGDGKTYTGTIEVQGPDSLKLKGCAFYVLCQEQQWVRVEDAAVQE